MTVKFFGQFLLERGKILKEELLDALGFQKTVNVKLGTIALDAGYLTADQIMKIHQEQQRTDKLFGEIAIEMNFLSPEQLEELLIIQKNERISLGDALLEKGYLSLHRLEEELREYKKSQEGMVEAAYSLLKQATSHQIPEIFLDLTIKLLRRLADLDVKVIDSHDEPERVAPHIWNVCQQFKGDSCGIYILSLTDRPLLKIASGIAEETLTQIDNFTKDGVQEFVNMLVGNSAAKLSQDGIKINLQPPEIHTSLSSININFPKSFTVSVKLATTRYEMQMSIIYTVPAADH